MAANINFPTPKSLEAEFGDIRLRAQDNWSSVWALRECFDVGLPAIEAGLVPYLDDSVRTTMGKDFPKVSTATNQEILKRMASLKVALARSLIDAAAIMVIQATLDSALNDYLLLIAKADPRIWEPDLEDEQLPLKAVKNKPYEELLRSKAISFAKSFSTKSLSKKIQLILDRCYRGDVGLSPTNFRFDVDRVKKFDDLRHDIAHGRAPGFVVENMAELLLFLWQTLLSLQDVVGSHLGLRYNPLRDLERQIVVPRSLKL